jgi:hypothetical protein
MLLTSLRGLEIIKNNEQLRKSVRDYNIFIPEI